MANIWNKVKDIKLKPHFIIFDYFFLNLDFFFRQSQTGRIFMYTLDGIRACFIRKFMLYVNKPVYILGYT